MSRRPLCKILAVLILLAGAARWLGISWIWKSPAGELPFQCARLELLTEASGVVYRQEENKFQNQIYTYLYLKQTNLVIESQTYPIRNIKCTIEGSFENFTGCKVKMTGNLVLPDQASNPGEFDQRSWEESRKIDFYLTNGKEVEILENSDSFTRAIEVFKKKIQNILQEIFPEKEAGIMEAMILGEKGSLEREVKNQFQAAGISHIVAISGLHMSMIGMGIWNGCKWLGLPMQAAALGSVMVLVIYGMVLGYLPTAFRALMMFTVMMVGKLLGRSYDILSSLSFAGIILILDNPDIIVYSGFQLSFLAILGIACYGAWEEQIFQKVWHQKKKWGATVRMGVSLWFFSLPVVLYSFYQVSVIGIGINLLVIPLMPVVLGSGLLALVLGNWSILWGSIAGAPACYVLKCYMWLADWSEKMSFGVWTPGQPQIIQMILYYVVLWTAVYGMQMLLPEQKLAFYKKFYWAVLQIGVKMILLLMVSVPWKNPCQVTVLDVGQGDGIVLQAEGNTALIDGGSTSRKQVGTYVLLPYLKQQGISCLDVMFITHADQDHVNGAIEVLEEGKKGWFSVKTLCMPWWMKENETGIELKYQAEQMGTEIVYIRKGDLVQFGSSTIQVLHPDEKDYSGDSNGGSLVLWWKTRYGEGIFMGDLPMEQEDSFMNSINRCSFLKAAHHGSNSSTSMELLKILQPEIAFLSCGERNQYGHPGSELLQRLEQIAAKIYRTDQQGAVTMKLTKKGNKIYVFGKE